MEVKYKMKDSRRIIFTFFLLIGVVLSTIFYSVVVRQDSQGNIFEVSSDSRLKNIGEIYTGGLDDLKKLELFNFTYKNDEKNIPHVGVVAQDLQKVFPEAVKKGSDGYLRIRFEDMFYALINAVKELDMKVAGAVEQIRANSDKIAKLQNIVDEQKQVINAQQITINSLNENYKAQTQELEKQKAENKRQFDELEKRLAKIEKTNKQ